VRPCSWYTHVHCENVVTSLSNQGIVFHSVPLKTAVHLVLPPDTSLSCTSSFCVYITSTSVNLAHTRGRWLCWLFQPSRQIDWEISETNPSSTLIFWNWSLVIQGEIGCLPWGGKETPETDREALLPIVTISLLYFIDYWYSWSASWIAKPHKNWRMSRLSIDVNFRHCLCYQQLARRYSWSFIHSDPLLYWLCVFCWKGGRPPLQAHPLSDQWAKISIPPGCCGLMFLFHRSRSLV
jgi:hypothetical protein